MATKKEEEKRYCNICNEELKGYSNSWRRQIDAHDECLIEMANL